MTAHNDFIKKKGFTLLEVMIFTAILSIVLVSSAAFVSRLIYNLRINEHKIYANHYATEIQEWLASEREADWNDLSSKATTAGLTYCMNTVLTFDYEITNLPAPAPCSSFTGLTPPIFERELTLVRNSDTNPTTVTATIIVKWFEGAKQYIEQIESLYTLY